MKTKNLKLKIVLFILTSLIFNLKSVSQAHAQNFDVGIYPPIIQTQITPPADVKIPIFLENYQDQSINLVISLKPFQSKPTQNGELEFIDNPQLPDPFIKQKIIVLNNNIPIDSITLSPKQKKQLTLSFQIPKNEPKGDYYFSLTFTSFDQNLNNSNVSQAVGGIASNILLTVGPIGKTQGLLEEFSAPKLISKGPVPFTISLRNISDHFISPIGKITISNMLGQTVGVVDLLQVNILADSVRRIPDKLQSGANEKNLTKIKAIIESSPSPVAVWPETFLLGFYKATLNLSLSDNGPLFTRTIYFFAFPFEFIISILITISIIIYIIIKIKRRMTQ